MNVAYSVACSGRRASIDIPLNITCNENCIGYENSAQFRADIRDHK